VVLLSNPLKPNTPQNRPIYARSGWEIPQEYLEQFHLDKLEAGLMKIRSQQLREWHPNAKIRSLSSYPYNCVGLVFASRRAVISIEQIYDILREDGFHAIPANELMVGDLVLYKYQHEPAHVALVSYISTAPRSITVLSRWGLDGEFLHFMEDVPAIYGTASEFYSERKP
jgi:hypothetical protein